MSTKSAEYVYIAEGESRYSVLRRRPKRVTKRKAADKRKHNEKLLAQRGPFLAGSECGEEQC